MEQPEDPAGHDPLLLFTPVPLARVRRNGWSPERQIAFIARLAHTGVVRVAAASVGMSARSAYQLRDRVVFDHPFACAWDAAMDRARDAAAAQALRSLTEPQEIPIIRRGRIIGTKIWFDERLALAALRVSSTLTGPPVPHAERRWTQYRQRDMAKAAARHLARRAAPPAPPPPETPEEAPAPLPQPVRRPRDGSQVRITRL